ncbi:YidH family protein [Dactylosporangium sp. CA-139066]|uniref:YidH family protein n=1 Tax=Dactylosporangium sp. CA-139066 TaxID=3239930 RepID=UPI003D8D07DC
MGHGSPRRFPASVYTEGSEPDARFSFANERTFLAWIRTSLALIAGGVALESLGLRLQPGLRLAASLLLIVSGVAVPVHAWFHWARSERALRREEPLPSPLLSVPLGVAVAVIGVLVALAVLLR